MEGAASEGRVEGARSVIEGAGLAWRGASEGDVIVREMAGRLYAGATMGL